MDCVECVEKDAEIRRLRLELESSRAFVLFLEARIKRGVGELVGVPVRECDDTYHHAVA